MIEQQTTILLPKGEWLAGLLVALKAADLELTAPARNYEYSFIAQSLPIVFQSVRSKEVPELIYDWDITANAGLTGTDIAADQRVNLVSDRNWEFPITELNPEAPQPKVYLGATPNLVTSEKLPTIQDINGTTIYTEYPGITQAFLAQNKLQAKVKSLQGGTEGRWRLDSRNGAIVTIRNTDATMRANEITPLLDIMSAGLLFMEGPNISAQDKERIDDLRELIFLALQTQN